jgi:hypothetical protein
VLPAYSNKNLLVVFKPHFRQQALFVRQEIFKLVDLQSSTWIGSDFVVVDRVTCVIMRMTNDYESELKYYEFVDVIQVSPAIHIRVLMYRKQVV